MKKLHNNSIKNFWAFFLGSAWWLQSVNTQLNPDSVIYCHEKQKWIVREFYRFFLTNFVNLILIFTQKSQFLQLTSAQKSPKMLISSLTSSYFHSSIAKWVLEREISIIFSFIFLTLLLFCRHIHNIFHVTRMQSNRRKFIFQIGAGNFSSSAFEIDWV